MDQMLSCSQSLIYVFVKTSRTFSLTIDEKLFIASIIDLFGFANASNMILHQINMPMVVSFQIADRINNFTDPFLQQNSQKIELIHLPGLFGFCRCIQLDPMPNQHAHGCRCWVAAHMCGKSHFRTCDVRAERLLELCMLCACVRLVFGSAMCDHTFAHFFEQKDKISALFIYRFQTNNLFTYFGSFKHFVPEKNMICVQQNWFLCQHKIF